MLQIGKYKNLNYTHFAFDGCHKFYLFNKKQSLKEILGNCWEEKDIFPISKLPEMFINACPLRFMDDALTLKGIVEQGQKSTTIKIKEKIYKLDLVNNRITILKGV